MTILVAGAVRCLRMVNQCRHSGYLLAARRSSLRRTPLLHARFYGGIANASKYFRRPARYAATCAIVRIVELKGEETISCIRYLPRKKTRPSRQAEHGRRENAH